jgi:hypothetical protein
MYVLFAAIVSAASAAAIGVSARRGGAVMA